MNKRLVWNFEINADTPLEMPSTDDFVMSPNRWESRFFWPDDKIITLNGLNDHFLALSHYQIKHREDTYYLLPDADYNLKIRRGQLVYKPILMKKTQAIAYAKKINLEEPGMDIELPGIEEKDACSLAARVKKQGIKVSVEKEALIYRFETTPTLKLELAWLHVNDKAYFSASIESHSMLLVESISHQLLGPQIASDYVSFLKEITK